MYVLAYLRTSINGRGVAVVVGWVRTVEVLLWWIPEAVVTRNEMKVVGDKNSEDHTLSLALFKRVWRAHHAATGPLRSQQHEEERTVRSRTAYAWKLESS